VNGKTPKGDDSWNWSGVTPRVVATVHEREQRVVLYDSQGRPLTRAIGFTAEPKTSDGQQ
jgi:hypothetical protein